MFKYAIIGFGGLGKLHFTNLYKLSQQRGDFKLAAICGATKEDFKKNVKLNIDEVDLSKIDVSDCNFYSDYKELIEKEDIDFAVAALPTYIHDEFAVYALSKGIHVFSEKPMALSLEGCKKMIDTARQNKKELMIGHCLRFDTAYLKIKEYIENNTFGKVCRAEFGRYSQLPTWSWSNWLLDPEKSGCCVLDMHIHDVDLINWYFGKPHSLRSVITNKKSKQEAVFTQYFYNDFFVTANADWSMTQKFPFKAECLINFEKATLVLSDGKITVYTDDEVVTPNIDGEDYFYAEMKAFLNLVIDGKQCQNTSAESIFDSVSMVLSEIESARKGTPVCF